MIKEFNLSNYALKDKNGEFYLEVAVKEFIKRLKEILEDFKKATCPENHQWLLVSENRKKGGKILSQDNF